MYATGDDYLPIVSKWLLSDMGVFSGVSKNGQRVMFSIGGVKGSFTNTYEIVADPIIHIETKLEINGAWHYLFSINYRMLINL